MKPMVVAATRTESRPLQNLIIRASAGTGKTFQLSNRFIQLILRGRPVDQILATTFTRKAAGEILERVMVRIADAAAAPESCARLASQLDRPDLSRDDCRRALRMLTRHLHRMRIATLDAFFLQATQSLSLELGLPPSWQIVDEFDEIVIRDEAIRRLVEDEDAAAVTQLMHSLTKGEARRGVHDLVRETVATTYEIFLETSREAWRGLTRQRTMSERQISQAIDDLTLADVPSVMRAAIEQDLRHVVDEDWDVFISKGIAAKIVAGETRYRRVEIPSEVLPAYERLVANAVAELRNRIALQTASTYDLVARFHRHFEAAKSRRRALLFSDLARRLAGLRDAVHLDHLSYRLDASVESLLLDEFQDTSLFQWNVIRPFATHACRDGPSGDFLCVGDEKQAIYGWRGGNADLLDAAQSELSNTRDMTLNTSRRSATPIIDFVNRVYQNFTSHTNLGEARQAVEDWTRRFPLHTTSLKHLRGSVTVRTSKLAEDEQDQTEQTIQEAVARVRELARRAPDLSIALLVRTNENVGRLIYQLHRVGVPASEEGGNPLIDSAAVQLVLSLLTLADHPGDSVARFHLSRSPWGPQLGLEDHASDTQAQKLSRAVRATVADVGFGHATLKWAGQLKSWCNEREYRRLSQLAELAFTYQQRVESPRTIGLQLQDRVSLRCDAFVSWIENRRVLDPSEDRVRVMTIHQSKGLQFDHVVLPDLDRGLYPQTPQCVVHRPSPTEPIDLVCRYASKDLRALLPARVRQSFEDYFTQTAREELCVLYVALTRARQGLDLILAPSKPTEKKLPRTHAGLIRSALTDHQRLAAEQIVYQDGEAAWLERSDRPSCGRIGPQSSPVVHVELAPSRSPRSTGVARPSSLEGDGLIRIGDRLSRPNASAMKYGSLIHAFLEQIEWIDEGSPDDSTLAAVARQLDADERHVEEALASFRGMLERSGVREVLSRHYYAQRIRQLGEPEIELEVRCEQPMMATGQGGIVSGSIDRLVLFKKRGRLLAADVVDYKTDSLQSPADLAPRVEHYRPQLRAYIDGVHRMLRISREQISGRLLFLSHGSVGSV